MGSKARTALRFYLMVLFVLLPLFYSDGYHQIGEDKFHIWLWGSIAFFMLLSVCGAETLMREGLPQLTDVRQMAERFSATDRAVLIYSGMTLVSWLFSPYRKDLFMGEPGWHMGLVIRLLSVAAYFAVSRLLFYEEDKPLLEKMFICTALVFFYGILNRFGCRPLPMGGSSEEFIGTIGNVDWFAGFYSVTFPVGVYAFLQTRQRSKLRLLSLYLLIGFSFGLVCGAQSCFLVLAMLLYLSFCISFLSNGRFRRFLQLLNLFICALWLMRILRLILPFDHETDDVLDFFTRPWPMGNNLFWIFIAVLVIALNCVFPRIFPGRSFRIAEHRKVRSILSITLVSLAVLYLIVILIRGRNPEFMGFLGEGSLFALNDAYGSSRGLIWRGSLGMFGEMGLFRKLIGVGPDGFSSFLYNGYSRAAEIVAPFDGARLTNGHNIFITELVNIGLLGLLSLLFLMRTFIRSQKRLFRKDPALPVFLFPVCAYLVYGLLNFDMVMNYPYLFIMMGAGEAMMRGQTESL